MTDRMLSEQPTGCVGMRTPGAELSSATQTAVGRDANVNPRALIRGFGGFNELWLLTIQLPQVMVPHDFCLL